MTRIEKIKQRAEDVGQKYFPNEHNIWARGNIEAKYAEYAFIEGVKWSDENPQKGLVSIDKACEWLTQHINDYINEYNPHRKDIDCLFEDFRKAMEE